MDYIKEHLLPGDIRDMTSLHSTASYPLTPAQAEEYERLDSISSSVMDEAETQCRKLRKLNLMKIYVLSRINEKGKNDVCQ